MLGRDDGRPEELLTLVSKAEEDRKKDQQVLLSEIKDHWTESLVKQAESLLAKQEESLAKHTESLMAKHAESLKKIMNQKLDSGSRKSRWTPRAPRTQ